MEIINKKVGDVFEITLDNRGASGLSMKYNIDNNDVIYIDEPKYLTHENMKPGDSVKISFKITAIKPGSVNILFYETRVWEKGFAPLKVRELNINVDA